VCAACHGLAAEGNEATSAPALAGLDDWYVVEQLRLYAEGLRGAQAGDVYGQQMRALASTFPDDEARRDLAAYIASLRE
jgi:cytochrome c oxidase subunit 2